MKSARRIVATFATASIAIGAASVTPAFAQGGDSTSSSSSTTRPASSTTVRPAGTEAVAFIEQWIARVQNSEIPAARKAELLARLNAFKAQAKVGPIDTGALQTVIRAITEALGRPLTTDAPRPSNPTTSVVRSTTTHQDDHESEDHAKEVAALIALLDRATAKVNESTLPDADKAALLEKIAAVKAKLQSGTPLGKEELGKLMSTLRETLSKVIPPSSTSSTTHAERPHTGVEQAIAAIEAQIARMRASDLPDDVKAKVIEALSKALEQIRASKKPSGDDRGKVRDDLAARKAARLAEMVHKLSGLADRIDAKADSLAGLPDSAPVIELAKANVAKAREQLSLASSTDDLKAIFGLLRDAKVALHQLEEAAENATSTTTAPTADTTAAA